MARVMLSAGMLAPFAAATAALRRALPSWSPPPERAATVISRMRRVKMRPRFASSAPFLCLIVLHFECPDIAGTLPPLNLFFRRCYHSPLDSLQRRGTGG